MPDPSRTASRGAARSCLTNRERGVSRGSRALRGAVFRLSESDRTRAYSPYIAHFGIYEMASRQSYIIYTRTCSPDGANVGSRPIRAKGPARAYLRRLRSAVAIPNPPPRTRDLNTPIPEP